jgi:hypothetical protein
MLFALALALLLGPAAAQAGVVVELSAGSGFRYDPEPIERTPTNVMLAGGYSIAGILKLELGLAANLSDVKGSEFELDLRPMVVVSPPLFPLYARGVFGVTNLVDGPQKVTYGGALGTSFGLLGVGVFLEAGVLHRTVSITTSGVSSNLDYWVGEGRLGVYFD